MAINIGTITSIGRTKDLDITPDDRQELVKVVDSTGNQGVVVEDYGVVADGAVISLSATFSAADYNVLSGYWSNRTRVQVTLDDGTVINNARIVLRRTRYADNVLNSYKTVDLEVWRV